MNRPVVELLKITRGVSNVTSPLITQPFHVRLNSIDEHLAFFFWIRVVKAKITNTTVLLSQPEIHGNRLRMPYVQKTVGLRRKTCDDTVYDTVIQIILDLCPEKITAWFCVHGAPLM